MNAQPVHFTTLGKLTFGDKFVLDIEDVFEPSEALQFLSFAYDGAAMVSAANTDFVRGFKTGLDKNTKVIKLSH
jgi:hypothetical protein